MNCFQFPAARLAEATQRIHSCEQLGQIEYCLVRGKVGFDNQVPHFLGSLDDFVARSDSHSADQGVQIDEFRSVGRLVDQRIGVEPGRFFDEALVKLLALDIACALRRARSLRRCVNRPVRTVARCRTPIPKTPQPREHTSGPLVLSFRLQTRRSRRLLTRLRLREGRRLRTLGAQFEKARAEFIPLRFQLSMVRDPTSA